MIPVITLAMPPKKAGSKGAKTQATAKAHPTAKHENKETPESKAPDNANSSLKKRKAQDSAAKELSKATRKSTRGAPSEPVDPVKLINYLLSSDCLTLCRPKDESSDLEIRGKDIRTYSNSTFTPFEELVCALILSRPIGHTLGLRSIRTLFNDPYNLNTPKAIRAAGREGCRQALDHARTQHRQKTAEELVLFADAVGEAFGRGEDDTTLERVREECGNNAGKEREMLKKHVKGLADTGVDIFARRIQGLWKEWYPFADQRTLQATEKLGLAADLEGLEKVLDDCWTKLDIGSIGGKTEEAKRKVFSKVLERAVGCELEGNVDEVRKAFS